MEHLTPHRSIIPPHDRADRLGQNPLLIWFTGLSGAGKSTLATHVEKELFESGFVTFYLDADQVRQGINQDLGFDATSRHENMRRVGHLSKQLMDAGLIVLAGFISPFRSDRAFFARNCHAL